MESPIPFPLEMSLKLFCMFGLLRMRILPFLTTWIAITFWSLCLYAESPTEIYQRRVVPLLQSSKASSCSECHLQGVNLHDFLTSDPKATFASLRARGWIDMEHPSESKILQFIAKTPENSTDLLDKVRKSELEGIGEWIRASIQDPESLNVPLPELTDLKLDAQLILHSRKDQVLTRFIDIIWSQMERCANCHSPDRNFKQVEKHGERMSWIVPNSPAETLQLLEDRQLINIEAPRASLLKTKALGKDEHGGGVKFPEDGHTEREWGLFLTDYAEIKRARYSGSNEIPEFDPMRTWRTGLHLKIKELPSLPAGQYAVVLMHSVTSDGKANAEPAAIGEGRVSKDGTSWGTSLKLIEPAHLRRTEASVDWSSVLPDGRYQLRWIVVDDSTMPLEKVLLLPYTMKTEIDSLWNSGHSAAKTISFRSFKPVDDLK